MHVEILVEDYSGKIALDILVQKILSEKDTFRVISYKGIGPIPKGMKDAKDPSRRILLTNLPKLLKGYGRTFAGYPPGYDAAVVLVCDLDDKHLDQFLGELDNILAACDPRPATRFCIAIEEGEAWLLGDISAVLKAFPNAKQEVLRSYENDSICGTWEVLADAVHPGGSRVLLQKGYQVVGAEKSRWAKEIAPSMNVEENQSPSFCYFRDELRRLGSDGSIERSDQAETARNSGPRASQGKYPLGD